MTHAEINNGFLWLRYEDDSAVAIRVADITAIHTSAQPAISIVSLHYPTIHITGPIAASVILLLR
jgi:hypothetical protein